MKLARKFPRYSHRKDDRAFYQPHELSDASFVKWKKSPSLAFLPNAVNYFEFIGVVTETDNDSKSVCCAVTGLAHIKKYNKSIGFRERLDVHDPSGKLACGDLVHIHQCPRVLPNKHYVVDYIIEPNIEARYRKSLRLPEHPEPICSNIYLNDPIVNRGKQIPYTTPEIEQRIPNCTPSELLRLQLRNVIRPLEARTIEGDDVTHPFEKQQRMAFQERKDKEYRKMGKSSAPPVKRPWSFERVRGKQFFIS